MSSWNFKDSLTISNGKFLNFLDASGSVKNNILGVDAQNNTWLQGTSLGDLYLKSGNNTFITSNTYIPTQLIVGSSVPLQQTPSGSGGSVHITLPANGTIGLNTATQGCLTLLGSNSVSGGSKIQLYGAGQVNVCAANDSGNVNVYTGNNSLKMQVLSSGTANFQPDGATIRLSISDPFTTITNKVVLSNSEPSTSTNTGALQVTGGVGVGGNLFVNGTLFVNGSGSGSGSLSIVNTQGSLSASSGAIALLGGLGIQCPIDASSVTSGGALTVAGGLALGQSAKINGPLTVFNTAASVSALTGSGVFYGGVGVNGQLNVRSASNPSIRLVPTVSGNTTSITFGSQNDYTTAGSWVVGQNVNSAGSSSFGIFSADTGLSAMTFRKNGSATINGSLVLNTVSTTSTGTFSAANGTNGNVTALIFDPATYRSFSVTLAATILRTSGGNYMTQYTLEGIQKDNGWNMYVTTLGDSTDLSFSINGTTGQIMYSTSTVYTNWVSTFLNYHITALYLPAGGLNTFTLPTGVPALTITNTTDSSNTSTGALVINGGVSIQKNLNVGGAVFSVPLYTILEERQPNGTAPVSYAAGSFVTRVLNTTIANSIPGCTLNSNQITLPAGTYRFNAFCPSSSSATKATLYNITDSTNTLISYGNTLSGIFTITYTTQFAIQQYWAVANSQMGGTPIGSGIPESYTHVEITRLSAPF